MRSAISRSTPSRCAISARISALIEADMWDAGNGRLGAGREGLARPGGAHDRSEMIWARVGGQAQVGFKENGR